ncbi:cation diffusion facilitator family transporter [Egbenema bharatensis]|uniref:cation diffusion facilitator family transporter n=1 Tax=Egbenema bharatensis TaxID=3463334 RepID=UPI003A887AAF
MVEAFSRSQAGCRALLIILWLTLMILAVKGWAGWATRSLSLLADSLHVLVDSFSTLLSLHTVACLRHTSGREVWGHRKRETAAVLMLVAILGFLGFSLMSVSVYQFQALIQDASLLPAIQVDLPLILLLTIVISIHICLVLFERYEANILDMAVLRLNANHVLTDIWLTIAMLLGLIGVWLGYVWLDSLMAIVLLFMLIPSLWRVLNQQLPSMMHHMAIAPEVLAQLALQVEGVVACQDVRSRGLLGRPLVIQMHLSLHPEFAVAAHLVTERLEKLLRERYGSVQTRFYVRKVEGKAGK